MFASITTGLEYSITNDFALGGRVVGVVISPHAQIAYPSMHVTFRLVRGVFQLGVEGGASFFPKQYASTGSLQGSAGTTLWASIPMRVIVPRRMKIYFSPEISTTVRFEHEVPADVTRGALDLPLSMLFRIVDPFAVGFASGYGIYALNRALETSYVPLGFWAVATVPGRQGPIADVSPSFTWPYLFMPGSSASRANAGIWQVALTVTAYVYDL
ncbi:Hypothetical protein A7982_01633 [Minicystis rosea]|nr:Hypothetical protein A7982_01633 [Minicystis rosea]